MKRTLVQRSLVRCVLAAAALAMGCSQQHASPATAKPETLAARSAQEPLLLGVCDHPHGLSKEQIDKRFNAVAAAGFGLVRWDVPWKYVETKKDVLKIPPTWDYAVDVANNNGAKSILILDYGNPFYDGGDKPISKDAVDAYVRYAVTIVRHFAGRVHYYEVWNEWNGRAGGTSWGKAKDYATLLKAAYPAIKAADPQAVVIGASLSSSSYESLLGGKPNPTSFEELMKYDIGDSCDVIGLHPYVVYSKGDAASLAGFTRLLNATVSKVRSQKDLVDKPIFVTELGWSTADASVFGVSEEVQKQNTLFAINACRNLGINTIVLYQLFDDPGPENETEKYFGMLRADGTPKPLYKAVCDLIRQSSH